VKRTKSEKRKLTMDAQEDSGRSSYLLSSGEGKAMKSGALSMMHMVRMHIHMPPYFAGLKKFTLSLNRIAIFEDLESRLSAKLTVKLFPEGVPPTLPHLMIGMTVRHNGPGGDNRRLDMLDDIS
jgi:hypothetical protein